MIHEDHEEHETMTEAHVLSGPIRMDPNAVVDSSKKKNYKNMWNRAEYQHRADVDAYEEFMKEDRRESDIMQVKGEW